MLPRRFRGPRSPFYTAGPDREGRVDRLQPGSPDVRRQRSPRPRHGDARRRARVSTPNDRLFVYSSPTNYIGVLTCGTGGIGGTLDLGGLISGGGFTVTVASVDASGFVNEGEGAFRVVQDGATLALQYSPNNGMLILVR
jgi:hypothetical protein